MLRSSLLALQVLLLLYFLLLVLQAPRLGLDLGSLVQQGLQVLLSRGLVRQVDEGEATQQVLGSHAGLLILLNEK